MSTVSEAPSGFVQVHIGGAFATWTGPLHARWHEDHLQLGFRVDARHVNPGNSCHGGMLATFADILISTASLYQSDIPRHFLPTINLQLDFMAAAPFGTWIQGQADVLWFTESLLFSQGLITADDQVIVRASGVFKRGPLLAASASDDVLQLPGMPVRPSR